MRFVNENSHIQCIRTNAENDLDKEVVVARFHSQIETVPPHVAAQLSGQEIQELNRWLEERSKLKAVLAKAPAGTTLLEALPALLQEATEALENIETMEVDLFDSIKHSLLKMNDRLKDFDALTEKGMQDLDVMQDSEVLKEQLRALKSKL